MHTHYKNFGAILGAIFMAACSTPLTIKTVGQVDIPRFMGDWYVLAGRFTSFEKNPYNAVESYKLNPDEDHIAVSFHYNKDGFEGEQKSIPQRAWVYNKENHSHWKVSPFWPLRFDYLIVGLAPDYSWTAIGVPDQKYLWIMARDWHNPEATIAKATDALQAIGYRSDIATRVPHQH